MQEGISAETCLLIKNCIIEISKLQYKFCSKLKRKGSRASTNNNTIFFFFSNFFQLLKESPKSHEILVLTKKNKLLASERTFYNSLMFFLWWNGNFLDEFKAEGLPSRLIKWMKVYVKLLQDIKRFFFRLIGDI